MPERQEYNINSQNKSEKQEIKNKIVEECSNNLNQLSIDVIDSFVMLLSKENTEGQDTKLLLENTLKKLNCESKKKYFFEKLLKINPDILLFNIEIVENNIQCINKKDVFLEIATVSPFSLLILTEKYINESYAEEILLKVAETEDMTMAYHFIYKNKSFAKNIISRAISHNPNGIEHFFTNFYFEKFNEMTYAKELILEAIKKNPISIFKYLKRGNKNLNNLTEIKECIKIAQNLIGSRELKRNDYLEIGETINYLHNESDEIRYLVISEFDDNMLYKLITNGRAEVFTSTYNGVLNRLITKLKSNGKDIYDLVKQNNFKGLNIFMEAATSYGRITDVLSTIKDENKKKELIDKLFDEEVISGDINNYICILEILQKLDGELYEYMIKIVKDKFENGQNKNAWGIIAKFNSYKSRNIDLKSIPDKYQISKIDGFKSQELFNKKGINLQQYCFYNDEDGESSYKNFINGYKGKTNWIIQDKGNYNIIKSNGGTDKSINIYANKPKSGQEGVDEVSQKIESTGLEPSIIVHRGHSYHTSSTLDIISPETKIVFLGSCGGFQNIKEVQDKSKVAQVISTKGTGSMLVNDPLLKAINEEILKGNDIQWESIWKKVTPKLKNNENFSNYIRPDKNLVVLFYNKYNKLEEKNT